MLLIDTNVFLEYKKLKLFFRSRELLITEPCLLEVEKIARKKKDSLLPKLIKNIKVIETKEKSGDNSIIEAAKKYNILVATFDKILMKSLGEEGVKVLSSNKNILSYLS
ncbi:MAG: hypothetical protein KAU95_01650 [Candidatus Aenigmarchaeota archaeon]|nr:hypothetical protein [Candidatus Aenigmarchaeota archaeon]